MKRMCIWFRPYRAIFRQRLMCDMQYRFSFWARISTNIFWGIVRALIIYVYYTYAEHGRAAIDGKQAVTMIWLGQIALNLAPGFGVDSGVWEKIRSGDVGVELIRPLDIYSHWYASAFANKLAPFLMAAIPVSAAGLIMPETYAMSLPASVPGLLACLVTLLTGTIVSCAAICLAYAMLMDVRVGYGPANAAFTVMQILAGGFLPLQLWPDWMQKFLYYQPFATLMDVPLRFYTGSAPIGDLGRVLLLQAVWTLALVAVGRFWIRRNLDRLVLQGG